MGQAAASLVVPAPDGQWRPAQDSEDRIGVAPGVEVRFISRDEWEKAAYVLVETRDALTPAQLDAAADSLIQCGLAKAGRVLVFDRETRIRLIPGESEWQRRCEEAERSGVAARVELAESEREREDLREQLATAEERIAAKPRSLAGRAKVVV